jgi:elongation factor G
MSDPNTQNRPIISVEISPKNNSDHEKLQRALQIIAQQDPTIQIKAEFVGGQTTLSGMSDLHLEVICDRILHEFKIPLEVGDPRVIYLEGICRHAEGEGKYIRQTGGFGNYAHCKLHVEPNKPGKGYEFINDIKDQAIPIQYIAPIDEGVQEALERGILAGHPMVDIKVTLFDGSYHEVDSNEMGFKIAGSMAFKEAARKALPIRLEPVMDAKITVPEEYIGFIINDLNSRRGRIEGIEQDTLGSQMITAAVPLAKMIGYGRETRSSTQGRAFHSMKLARYEAASRPEEPGDDYPYVAAKKPTGSKPGSGSAAASLDAELK